MDLKPRHLNHKYLKGHFSISSFRSYVFYGKPSSLDNACKLTNMALNITLPGWQLGNKDIQNGSPVVPAMGCQFWLK